MIQLAGTPRVEGDEEEDDIDDLDNEFCYGNLDALGSHQVAEAVLSSHLNVGRGSHYNARIPTHTEHESSLGSEIPLLTYGEEVNQSEILVSSCLSVHACQHVRTVICHSMQTFT